MKTKKRTEITIERERVLVIRQRKFPALAWCRACGARVKMLTPEEAATIARTTSRTIYRRVEAGQLHFTETADGMTLICIHSLLG